MFFQPIPILSQGPFNLGDNSQSLAQHLFDGPLPELHLAMPNYLPVSSSFFLQSAASPLRPLFITWYMRPGTVVSLRAWSQASAVIPERNSQQQTPHPING